MTWLEFCIVDSWHELTATMKSVFSKYATDPHILPSFQAKLNVTKLNMDKQ